jgi:iron(III) transport system substrate-binding protein
MSTKRFLPAFGLLAAIVPGLAGAQLPTANGEVIGTPELVKAACAEGQVIYYTSQSDGDERAIIEPFAKQFPCIKVSVVSAVTGRLYERVRTETQAGKPQGDVMMITDEALTQQLMDAKLLAPWTPPADAAYPSNAKVSGWWYAGSGAFMVAIYNTELVTAADAPKTWTDLLNPKWRGQLATSPITIGGTAWMQFAFMHDVLGADYLKKFVAQEPKLFPAYNPVVLSVARGEQLVGVTAALNEYSERVGNGAPIATVFPAEGVPFTNYPLMLLANGPHPHAGELFANWYLSKVGQAGLVRVRGAYSARADVASAPGNPPLAQIKRWNPGHDAILKEHDALLNEVLALFGRR